MNVLSVTRILSASGKHAPTLLWLKSLAMRGAFLNRVLDFVAPVWIRRHWKWLAWIGLALCLGGVSFAVSDSWWETTRTWQPLNMPVTLTVGHIRSPEFLINLDERFELQLDVDREIPPALLDRVLGIGQILEPKTELSGFKFAWTLSSDGQVLKRGISGGGKGEAYWGGTDGRNFGHFSAKKGSRYRLDLDVLQDGSQLAPYHPRLKVGVDLFTLDGYFMGHGIAQVGYLAIAVIGFVVLLYAFIARSRTTRRASINS